jgi:hypothetical protein
MRALLVTMHVDFQELSYKYVDTAKTYADYFLLVSNSGTTKPVIVRSFGINYNEAIDKIK